MDADALVESGIGDGNAAGLGEDANNNNIVERISSGGEMMRDIESAGEVLTRIELDLACSSEKLVNLSILMMHVATKESELEAFISDEEYILKKALEFDLLSGVLDSEVNELDNFMSTLQAEIVDAREIISSYEHLGEALKDMEEKLHDSEESLKQSVEQVTEIKEQSSNFQRILLKFSGEETRKLLC